MVAIRDNSTREEELFEAYRRGDEGAAENFFITYSPLIRSVIANRASKRDVEDYIQEVFLKIHQNRDDYDSSKGSLPTWICTITRNTVIDLYRKSLSRGIPDQVDLGHLAKLISSSPETSTNKNDFGRLNEYVGRLRPEEREIIYLLYGRQLSLSEISRFLGLPGGTPKSRLSRALKRIKKDVEIHNPELARDAA